jgi:hypothetical protein
MKWKECLGGTNILTYIGTSCKPLPQATTMYLSPQNKHHTHTTPDGKTVCIVPRPALLRVNLDADGNPISVVTTNQSQWGDGFSYWTTLLGINKETLDRIRPDLVIYELADGSLLQADPELFDNSEMNYHRAATTDTPCFQHWVKYLRLVEMPEWREEPIYQF